MGTRGWHMIKYTPPPVLSRKGRVVNGHTTKVSNNSARPLPLRVGVGWQRRCKTRHPLRKLGNQVTDFLSACVFCGNHDGGRARSYCAG